MAENEIQILIKAVDEATNVLKSIEKQVSTSGKNIQKQTDKTSKSFDKEVKSLIGLGNAAAAVDSIFDSYSNMQLRVENSTERVIGAQDRLYEAQYNLSRVMSDSSASAEDIANAQRQVESSTRSLTIAQNNLERTNNAVTGTYISMGIQSLTLIKSLPELVMSINNLSRAGLAFIATPLGATLATLGIAVAGVTKLFSDQKRMNEELTKTNDALKASYDKLTQANKDLAAQPFDEAKAKKELEISEKKLEVERLRFEYMSTGAGEEKLKVAEFDLSKLQQEYDIKYVLEADLAEKKKRLEEESYAAHKAVSDKALQDYLGIVTIKMTKENEFAIQREQTQKVTMSNIQTNWNTSWTNMQKQATINITAVNTELNKIPRDIYTYHHIVTVYDSGGKKK